MGPLILPGWEADAKRGERAAAAAAGRSVLRAICGVDFGRSEVVGGDAKFEREGGSRVSSVYAGGPERERERHHEREAKRARRGEDFVRKTRPEREELSRIQEVCEEECSGSAK